MIFGREMLQHWLLDTGCTYLNHGALGVTPRIILSKQFELREAIERQPSRFLLREMMGLEDSSPTSHKYLRAAAGKVASFVGASGEDLVFVDNVSVGINTILRSISWKVGDEIVLTDHAYGAVRRAASFIARENGVKLVRAKLPYPVVDEDACVSAVEEVLTPRTRLAIVDHITSESSLVLPLARIAAVCRKHAVPVLADGAHAPGSIDLQVPELGVTWYVGCMHKWAFAPRGCGFIWATLQNRVALHPLTISWGLDIGWHKEFDWTGARDPTPYLCAPEGVKFIAEFLGERSMREYNHLLAWTAAKHLNNVWGGELTVPEKMVGCMVTIALPSTLGLRGTSAASLGHLLSNEFGIEIPIISRNDRLWVRISAQVYNDFSDIEQLAVAINQLG